MRTYGKYSKLTSTVVFGGVGIHPQIAQFKRGVDILVATPGRLLDHLGQGTVNLSHVEILVLDEADRMLDMGFIRDIKRILALLPKRRQNLLFSATFSDEIKTLADGLLNAPAMIEVARRNSTVEIITQKVHPVDRDRKRELLSHLIKTQNWHQVLVFTRTKHGANKLAEQLNHDGITALAIHGNKSQSARTRALAEFKDGDLQVLVRHRHRGARHRHRPVAARGQLRPAERSRGLRAPHRPHRPRRRDGRGDLARLRRRARFPARHRAADQARDSVGRRSRFHAGSVRAAATHPAAPAARRVAGTFARRSIATTAAGQAQRAGHVQGSRGGAQATRPSRRETRASRGAGGRPRRIVRGQPHGAAPAARTPGARPPAVRRFGGKVR